MTFLLDFDLWRCVSVGLVAETISLHYLPANSIPARNLANLKFSVGIGYLPTTHFLACFDIATEYVRHSADSLLLVVHANRHCWRFWSNTRRECGRNGRRRVRIRDSGGH